MAAPKPKKINLLVQEGFENSQIGKILAWLLTVGRAIVIVVELVVICAFLSRFWFDRQLTDLIEDNNAKRSQIEASSTFEEGFKSTQARLSLVRQIDQVKLSPSGAVSKVTSLLPDVVNLTNISFTGTKLTLNGTSLTEGGVAGLMKSLGNSSEFENVSLSNIALDRGAAGFIKFTVETDLKGGGE